MVYHFYWESKYKKEFNQYTFIRLSLSLYIAMQIYVMLKRLELERIPCFPCFLKPLQSLLFYERDFSFIFSLLSTLCDKCGKNHLCFLYLLLLIKGDSSFPHCPEEVYSPADMSA